LRKQILARLPHAQVDGAVGRTGSFEISVNGKNNLLFSKLETKAFPDTVSLMSALVNYVENGAKQQVKSEPPPLLSLCPVRLFFLAVVGALVSGLCFRR